MFYKLDGLGGDNFQMKIQKMNAIKLKVKELNESIESLRKFGVECNSPILGCKTGFALDEFGVKFYLSVTP
jgi:hypothetical protein